MYSLSERERKWRKRERGRENERERGRERDDISPEKQGNRGYWDRER